MMHVDSWAADAILDDGNHRDVHRAAESNFASAEKRKVASGGKAPDATSLSVPFGQERFHFFNSIIT